MSATVGCFGGDACFFTPLGFPIFIFSLRIIIRVGAHD